MEDIDLNLVKLGKRKWVVVGDNWRGAYYKTETEARNFYIEFKKHIAMPIQLSLEDIWGR